MFEHIDTKKVDELSVELETIKTLAEFSSLMNTLQERWSDMKMNFIPNLSRFLELKFSIL